MCNKKAVLNVKKEEAHETLLEAVRLLINLRTTTEKWKKVYGFDAKQRMNYWEEKSDEFIESVVTK